MAVTIPRAVLEFVTNEVNGISADAQARVLAVLESITWTPENIAECRDIVLQALAAVMPTYTDAAAQVGADMYDAVRREAVGEAMGAVALSGYEPDATEGAIRAFVQDIVDGKPAEQFNRRVLERIDSDIRSAENSSVAENAARDPLRPKFSRVPTGPETCEWCIMLASRGFVYTSRKAASHSHPGCDCRIVQGYPDMAVEGYDPESYYAMWKKSEEMKASGTPRAQRDAVLAAMRGRLIPHYSAPPTELAALYQEGVDSAWREFKRLGKSADSYEATVGAFLRDMGEAAGIEISGAYTRNRRGKTLFAEPDGNELWAASRLVGIEPSVEFLPSDRSAYPDIRTRSGFAEIKTPKKAGKTATRLKHAAEQLDAAGDGTKRVYLSALLVDDAAAMMSTAKRFVDDGTLDEIYLIRPDVQVEPI